ncbi:MAG TPA: mersacidin/lichenicidin family type 2 lantibiotic [Ktedonobacteraceae bacterium]|jgi:mersacidin/lichenicidin family type 2 lantibiotic|nr:mersacidin/lichenicidin family type 2 lantibiotic [Ktedonobacteraceae bacterium]
MKFDVVRAWKDEKYRQNLNEEELTTLPAHPAGELELTDDELETVFGGSHGLHASGIAAAYAKNETLRSYALICEINIFSINIEVLTLDLISIGNPRSKVCVHHD